MILPECPPNKKCVLCAIIVRDRYDQLVDAVYKRRGWTRKLVYPNLETLPRELGIDFPEVVDCL